MRRKTVSGIMLTLLLIGMLALAFNIQPVKAGISPYSPAEAISIDPVALTLLVCHTGTVNLIITNITDCAGYDFWLYYNAILLSVTNINIDTGTPGTPSQIAPSAANRVDTDTSVSGIVKYSVVWKAGVPTYNGSGVAAQITFKGKTVGYSVLNFDPTWTHAYDYYGDEILFDTFCDGETEVIPDYTRTLTIYSSPTGVTFTVDSVSHTTAWSETYCENTSVSLVMPEIHDEYVWSRWLEDGDPNRIKTVIMDKDLTLTAVYTPPPPPVGGKATPINTPMNKPETPTLWIWLTILLPLIVTAVFVKCRKKQ